jgi:hypothetical protein
VCTCYAYYVGGINMRIMAQGGLNKITKAKRAKDMTPVAERLKVLSPNPSTTERREGRERKGKEGNPNEGSFQWVYF